MTHLSKKGANRNSRAALFDDIEERLTRTSSYSSHEIQEYDNDKSLDGLQDRVNILKRPQSPAVTCSHSYEVVKELKYITRCIFESMRLYPHPPVLIRRAQVDDILPGDYKVKAGQDIMISVYNIHRSSEVWDKAEDFVPERFDLEGPMPNETNTDFRFIPFSGGPRKCVGDQFALLEAIVALAIVVQRMDFQLVADQNISMTTGATIHTTNGLYMTLKERRSQQHSAMALSALEQVA